MDRRRDAGLAWYVAPQLGAGTKNLYHDGYQVTNAGGNLVDLNGNQIDGAYLTNYPGFPGHSTINASQTLAYMADMLEAGVPVVTGPGIKHLGLDGSPPDQGPNSAGPDSGQTVVSGSGTTGTWVDETDIRPTEMYLVGLKDDYEHDGRVITQILADPNGALSGPGVASLGACYKQLDSSVGQFANYTLQADTKAIESSTPGDAGYIATDKALAALEKVRDALALRIKGELEAAAFGDVPVFGAQAQTFACQAIIASAAALAHSV